MLHHSSCGSAQVSSGHGSSPDGFLLPLSVEKGTSQVVSSDPSVGAGAADMRVR